MASVAIKVHSARMDAVMENVISTHARMFLVQITVQEIRHIRMGAVQMEIAHILLKIVHMDAVMVHVIRTLASV